MIEEAKKLITEYRRCEVRLEELSSKLVSISDEYKKLIKESINQDKICDFEKQIRTIVNEHRMYNELYNYKDAIREVLLNKFDMIPYYDRIEVSDVYLGIENIKAEINHNVNKTAYMPDDVRNEIIKLIKSVVNETNKAEAEAFKDKNN